MIATVFALEFESAGYRAIQVPQMCVCVWTLGVTGHRSAPALKRLMEKNRPQILVSAGFSGALKPELGVGSVVIGENYSDPQILSRLPVSQNFRVGPVITAGTILETSVAKRDLGEKSGALAVDLESAHLHEVCRSMGVPMISIRCISDTVDQDLPLPGSVLINPDTGKSDPALIFQYLFRHPAQVSQFARLISCARTAQRSLAGALGEILPNLLRG
ncbi:MAG: hypothetical protein ACOYM3_04015 [Terrimicrobiaceae bacterium]